MSFYPLAINSAHQNPYLNLRTTWRRRKERAKGTEKRERKMNERMEKTEKTPVPRNFWLRPMLSAADIVFVCQCVFVHLCMSVRGKRKKLLMRN